MSDERPQILVHTDHNPDEVRSFYEIPDVVARSIQPEGDSCTFVQCLVDLMAACYRAGEEAVSEKWIEAARSDGVRTFQLRPSAQWWYTVHVRPGGHSEVVRSPMGILVESCPSADEAREVAERHAGEEARSRVHMARRDLVDAERALAFLTRRASLGETER